MQAITKELLKDPGARKDLQFALADILGGIRDDWDLSTPECRISAICARRFPDLVPLLNS